MISCDWSASRLSQFEFSGIVTNCAEYLFWVSELSMFIIFQDSRQQCRVSFLKKIICQFLVQTSKMAKVRGQSRKYGTTSLSTYYKNLKLKFYFGFYNTDSQSQISSFTKLVDSLIFILNPITVLPPLHTEFSVL